MTQPRIVSRRITDRPSQSRTTEGQVKPATYERPKAPWWAPIVLIGVLGGAGFYGMQKAGIKYVGRKTA